MNAGQAKSLLFGLLPRSFLWRLGRSMYMHARGDLPNRMSSNGELWFLTRLIEVFFRTRNDNVTVFDIGANVGEWSASALRLIRNNRWRFIAFEPDPDAATALRDRFKEDNRLMVEQVALSSVTGVTRFYRSGPATGTNSLTPPVEPLTEAIEVNTDTLTNYCKNHGIHSIDMIKCDAEGHDFDILLGARELLGEQAIGAFQFEYNHRWILARRYLKDIFDMICGLPYKVGKIQPRNIIIFDQWHPELDRFFEANYVLLHEGVLPYLPVRNASWDSANTMRLAPPTA